MENKGPIPFHFNSLWLSHKEFHHITENSWKVFVKGSPSFMWESKLRILKFKLKNWEKAHYKYPQKVRMEFQIDLDSLYHKM